MATLDHIGLNRFIYMSASADTMTLGSTTLSDVSNSSGNSILGGDLHNTRLLLGINLYNNGPYGHSSWQQLRMSENPLSRHLRRNNQFPIVENGKEVIIVSNGKRSVVSERHGPQLVLDEPSVVSSYKPIHLFGTVDVYNQEGLPFPKGLTKKISLDNNSAHFTNIKINGITGMSEKTDEFYDILKGYYLENNLNSGDSPLSSFEKLIYSQTIYPPQQYTYKSYTRARTTFSFNWNSDIYTRQQTTASNNFGTTIRTSSVWPLDVDPNWSNLSLPLVNNLGIADRTGVGDPLTYIPSSFGVLWNHYSQFAKELDEIGTTYRPGRTVNANDKLMPAPLYSRRHSMPQKESVTAPTGKTGLRATSHIMQDRLFGGEAAWDTPMHSGKYPFHDSYAESTNETRRKAKNFTIVPEFRMSEHVPLFMSASPLDAPLSLFEITGAKSGVTDSSIENFYTIYTNSDFLKNFELVLEDHKDFTDPSKITLKCKAYKKLIPYNGFYPVQRSVNLSEQFYSSYNDFLEISSSAGTFGSIFPDENDYTFQILQTPLFAPGVLFNSIKAGIACDYPIFTTHPSNFGTGVAHIDPNGGMTFTAGSDTDFDKRIPFEALIEPEKYLSNTRLVHNEPHPSGNLSGSAFWDGQGDRLYSMMANNFLAEIPNFFLKNNKNTTLVSLPQGDPNFGQTNQYFGGNVHPQCYTMRVRMYRSMDKPNQSVTSADVALTTRYVPPQDIVASGRKETITMYSRPSAFGPPTMYQITRTQNPDPTALFSNKIHSAAGFNYPFTPPYYHGQSWADITFKPDDRRKYSLSEILASSSIEYYRFDKECFTTSTGATDGDAINDNAMQLDASLNLLSKGIINQSDGEAQFNIQVDDQSKARWVIQPKFETPILNFADYAEVEGHASNVTLPTDNRVASQVPIGMWHQYGRLPSETEGIYLQVTDIPKNWVLGRLGRGEADYQKTGSLAELCGFSQNPVKLGQVSEKKKISECVVAVPFIEEAGVKQFFKLHLDPVNQAINGVDGVDETYANLVDKINRFIFPPSFDFVNFPENVDPIAMYVFEFSTQLSQQDLTDIWQNVLPNIGRQDEVAESSISHSLIGNRKFINRKGLREDIRWMVFKVKQRAAARYYDQVFTKKGNLISNILGDDIEVDQAGLRSKIQYNWPYDFFSLVELVKIDASVEFSDVETDDNGVETTIPKVASEENRIRQLGTLFPRDKQ